jgi:toluene monooxygenase system ferredoxin subunit
MAFKMVCKLDDIWEGDMLPVDVDGHEVLLIRAEGDRVDAFQGTCPHQDIPLCEGTLKSGVLTCRAHLWTFDVASGQGINPAGSQLARYPVRVDGEDVCVDVAGIVPCHAVG